MQQTIALVRTVIQRMHSAWRRSKIRHMQLASGAASLNRNAKGMTHVRFPQSSEASSVLSSLLHDFWLKLTADLTFLSLSSCGVGASSRTCPVLHDQIHSVNCMSCQSTCCIEIDTCFTYITAKLSSGESTRSAHRGDRGFSERELVDDASGRLHVVRRRRGIRSTCEAVAMFSAQRRVWKRLYWRALGMRRACSA